MKVNLIGNKLPPLKAHEGDAGYDLFSPIDFELLPGAIFQVKLGYQIEINPTEVALVQGRSGLALKYGISTIGNVIDSNYRGEISAILVNHGKESKKFLIGDRVAQLLILRLGDQTLELTDQLSSTERGNDGFGSSGLSLVHR